MPTNRSFTTQELCEIGEEITRESIELLQKGYNELRAEYLEHVISEITGKPCLMADKDVENEFRSKLKTRRGHRFESIRFFGEESFRKGDVDLTNELNTCVLVDALDGSDLYEREIGNWCSASIFFTPQNAVGNRIRAAVVGLPDGTIYIANDDENYGVVVKPPDERVTKLDEDNPHRMLLQINKAADRELRGTSTVMRIADASICFYGQKIGNLRRTTANPGWLSQDFAGTDPKRLVPRVYNLAGIPMIMRLIDKPSETGSGIDLVVELEGQHPHDVVPGAFLAKRAGAAVVDLEGKEITYQRLEEVLRKPNVERMTYIIASTLQLAHEAAELFGGDLEAPSPTGAGAAILNIPDIEIGVTNP